jgi:hypothetical protein
MDDFADYINEEREQEQEKKMIKIPDDYVEDTSPDEDVLASLHEAMAGAVKPQALKLDNPVAPSVEQIRQIFYFMANIDELVSSLSEVMVPVAFQGEELEAVMKTYPNDGRLDLEGMAGTIQGFCIDQGILPEQEIIDKLCEKDHEMLAVLLKGLMPLLAQSGMMMEGLLQMCFFEDTDLQSEKDDIN